ncbi:MAG TPA: ferritin-like domain-containing protein, partial [Candidatus Acidoferrum sp.]|nr:ferritin-like domain-containing protein [Candidatus Acidoferrum sp.]
MKKKDPQISAGLSSNRRSFLKKGVAAAGAATMGAGLLSSPARAFAAGGEGNSTQLNRGDVAILRFLQALETIEADLWRQYAELAGAVNAPGASPIDLPFPTGLAGTYISALQNLDGDMPQYIADNTDDELSHAAFLSKYLEAKGIESADLTPFKNITPSQVSGVPGDGRLTNLTQLTVDTTWWTRYRSDNKNQDLGDSFPQAVPGLFTTPFPAIPRTNSDVSGDPNFVQAVANVAGFHFGFVEQGGTSLYPQLAQRVTHPEALRILLSIGPSEAMHFQTWHDKAGNGVQPPVAPFSATDPVTGATLSFPNLNDPTHTAAQADALQTNLIMPEPTFFLNPKFGPVSIVRPTETRNA